LNSTDGKKYTHIHKTHIYREGGLKERERKDGSYQPNKKGNQKKLVYTRILRRQRKKLSNGENEYEF